jgi:ribosomal protein L11 methyltransferase
MPEAMSEATADNRYFRLRVEGLRRADEDMFMQIAFEAGAAGVTEDLAFVQPDLCYEPDVVENPILNVNVYFETAPQESGLLQLQGRFPEARFELLAEENRDWLAEWKKGFKAFQFAGPFWVVPSWLTPPPEAPKDTNQIIFVEPGMAFGTGTHETTRLAASLIIEELNRKPCASLIDVGTGTAILAQVARRLGVQRIVGIDNDPEALRTARENLERNNEGVVEILETQLEDIQENFDIVVANIIDGILTLLRHDLKRVLKPGGRMILSGVLTERESEFYENFTRETGLRLIKKVSDGEWSAALLADS